MKKIAIIGGGASGYFLAANLGMELGSQTVLFEQSQLPLQKVRVSGGSRCNVTHACFDPNELVDFYPRGKKELRSVFHQFQPADTMQWFQERGVELKVEADNRVFPVSNSSISIIECLLHEAEKNNVDVRLSEGITEISHSNNIFKLKTKTDDLEFDTIIIATGSSPKCWGMIKKLGHSIVPPVPSLFTFNVKNERIKDLQGVSFNDVEIKVPKLNLSTQGDLLITHWGFSGPAILRLSAWGALDLNAKGYSFSIQINFINSTYEDCIALLMDLKKNHPKKSLFTTNPFEFPKRFWQRLLTLSGIDKNLTFSDINKRQLNFLAQELTCGTYNVNGKSTFKDEFVTAGGVNLKEINFKTMESNIIPNLYFMGEVLNIDAITGGFNFQACWSEAFITSQSLKKSL